VQIKKAAQEAFLGGFFIMVNHACGFNRRAQPR